MSKALGVKLAPLHTTEKRNHFNISRKLEKNFGVVILQVRPLFQFHLIYFHIKE